MGVFALHPFRRKTKFKLALGGLAVNAVFGIIFLGNFRVGNTLAGKSL